MRSLCGKFGVHGHEHVRALLNRERCSLDVMPRDGEESATVVQFNGGSMLAGVYMPRKRSLDPSGSWQGTADQDVNALAAGRNLAIAGESIQVELRPGINAAISGDAVIQVDTSVVAIELV